MKRLYFLLSLLWVIGLSPLRAAEMVEIAVDSAASRQIIDGFGANMVALYYDGLGDAIGENLRAQAIEAVYGQVQLSIGTLDAALLETPDSYENRRNDNADAAVMDWQGFNPSGIDNMVLYLLEPARQYGFAGEVMGQRLNLRWTSPWLKDTRAEDYERYLDEAAEQVAAGLIYWRDTYGVSSAYNFLLNEPLSGNWELDGGGREELVDLVKRVGGRLRQEGFDQIKFVVPNEETAEESYSKARDILADPEARQYVGVIGYHVYPYGGVYVRVRSILATSGQGKPSAEAVEERQKLAALGEEYGVRLWMTEISHGDIDPLSYDSLRGRAIHIHDELIYANASAYYAGLNMWDSVSAAGHGGDLGFMANEGDVVLIDVEKGQVHITGMGYALGHYARWVKPGALRVEASSNDPLVQVTAFRDDALGRMVLVVINNASAENEVRFSLGVESSTHIVMGEQSTEAAYWQALDAMPVEESGDFRLTLPALSVTTLVVEDAA